MMRHFGTWLALLVSAFLVSETSGLRFNDDTYVVDVWETPASDHDLRLISDPPTPITGVVVTAACINDNGTPVDDVSDLRYNIVEGNTSLFSINEMTGDFSVADQSFDYEEQPWYLVRLLCYLNSNLSKNGTGAVNVTIGHLNEYLPEFEDMPNSPISIPETTTSGAIIAATDGRIGPLLTYSAVDADSGPDSTILYVLEASGDDRFFELNKVSGTLTLSAELDVDDLPSIFQRLEISIIVCNENVTLDICNTKIFTIFVTSVNEFAPVFTKPNYIATVNETEQNGTSILEVVCIDDDNMMDTTLFITFHSDTPSSVLATFELFLGSLLLRSELDYENTTKYDFLLVCSDGENTATTQVTVNVLPQNETSGLRFNDNTYVVNVWETPASDNDLRLISDSPTPITGVVVTVACINDNGTPVDDVSDLRYNIVEGNTSLFSINEMTGDFSVADQSFDYEEQPWYLVRLLCYLNSNLSKNGTGAVNVTIGHLNEYLPEFEDLPNAPISIPETTTSGAIIAATDGSIGPLLTYSAVDADSGPDGTILYVLEASGDDRFFELNKVSGTLTLSAELDVDDLPSIFQQLEISIIVCNENVTLDICNSKVFTIFVTSVNEFAPVFTKANYIATVNETEQNGTAILEVVCIDDDNMMDTTLFITFHSDTPSSVLAAFELFLGSLLLRSELDYENTTKYDFLLICSDGENTATTQVTVNVLPQNDNVPYFTIDSDRNYYEFSADRSNPSPSETIIGVVRAEDDDSHDVLTYSIDSSSHFNIDSETGEITLKGYLYVKDGRAFDFEVVASDGEHETRARVRVTTTGLLSVPEWIYVGLGSAVLLVILAIVGIIVFYCFIKAARVRIVEKYKERQSDSDDSKMQDIPVGPAFPNPHMFAPHPAMFPHDGGMSMVGQPLFPGMEDEEEEEESEPSATQATLEDSQYNLTSEPILVGYFQEGDNVLDKKEH